MERYLLDTNAFFEMFSFLAGRNVRTDAYNFQDIRQGECYISKITELEILSVIGKYGRGEPSQWQNCDRQIADDGAKCTHRYFHKGNKPWNNRLCADLRKLMKEMIAGTSSIITLHVLDINEDIIYVVTSDRALRVAMKEEGIDFIVTGTTISHPPEK